MARLQSELTSTKKSWAEEKHQLALQLADENADKEMRLQAAKQSSDAQASKARMEKEEKEGNIARLKVDMSAAADHASRQYAALEGAKARAESQLQAQLQQLAADKAASEEKLNERIKRLEQAKLQETTLLKSRVDRLSKLQDAALTAGGTKARALLYIEAMKSKVQQKSSISIRGEADSPTGLPGSPTGSLPGVEAVAEPVASSA